MKKTNLLFLSITLIIACQISSEAEITLPPPPNQLGPIYDHSKYSVLNDNDPNIVKEVDRIMQSWSRQPALAKPIKENYWQRRYHRQINGQVFQISRYPFYSNGQSYATGPALATEPNAPRTSQQQLEQMLDLIHRWRNLNESEAVALEIRYAIELTKTSTSIYQNHADLAVEVKRRLGQFGRTNAAFDLVSRQGLAALLEKEPLGTVPTRLEKYLADMENLLQRLTEHNDAISEVLGKGRIQRITVIPDYLDRIDYSADKLPDTTAALSR